LVPPWASAKTSRPAIYDCCFATSGIKTPLQHSVLANGWRWQGVAFGKM
jgi:hypothetical protein